MCSNIDWDEWLSYPTVKVVKVKDRYLGLLRFGLLTIIFGYIIGYVIIYNKGYYATDVPVGAIELSLKKPDGWIYPQNYDYCIQSNYTNIIDPLYCQVQDGYEVYNPVDQTAAMFITTRFSQTLEKYECDLMNGCDTPWVTVNDSIYNGEEFYIPAIENFTIKMSHFFQARDFYLTYHDKKYAKSNDEMKGKLTKLRGKHIKQFGSNSSDIMELSLLLDSVNVNLNSLSEVPTNINESKRHSGIILVVGIDYSNFDSDKVKYQYTVSNIKGAEYKVVTQQKFNSTLRLLTDRHGVKIFFLFSGTIVMFDFQTLLINLVSGLGLLGLATFGTDLLMTYILPLKNVYNKYKFQITKEHETLEKYASQKLIQQLDNNNSNNDLSSISND